MAETLPLGSKHYLQFLRVSRDAPRREPSWTTELDGKHRYGRGQTLRLFGRYAVVVGTWTDKSPEDLIEESTAGLGHDISPEQFATLQLRFQEHNEERLREGWIAPKWHWRRYWLLLQPYLQRFGVIRVDAYNLVTWRRPPWLPRKPSKDGWQPLRVVQEPDEAA